MLYHLQWRVATLYLILLLLSVIIFAIFRAEFTPVLLIAVSLTLLASFLVTIYVTRAVIHPVRKLTELCRQAAGGKFDQKIETLPNNEVGELIEEFNRMSAQIAEKITLLSKERNELVAIISTMSDGIIITDVNGRVELVNPAAERIFQLHPGKAVGRSFIELARDYELSQTLEQTLKTGKQQTRMIELGQPKQLLRMVVTPLPDAERKGGLVVLQDLTELRRLETMRREFVTNVSHELRTPLASAKALIETLQEGAIADPIAAKSFLEKAQVEINRLTQLVQELGDLSRLEAGGAALEKELQSIEPVLRRIVRRLQVQADRAGIELTMDIPATLPEIWIDEERIEQVMVNLLHNAVKFTPPGGKVVVSARSDGKMLLVSVTDTGVGISAEDLPRVFERFYKADKSRSEEGIGLGLAIAKHIVQAHGGDIQVESTEGRGSIFTFTLPLGSS